MRCLVLKNKCDLQLNSTLTGLTFVIGHNLLIPDQRRLDVLPSVICASDTLSEGIIETLGGRRLDLSNTDD